MTYSAKQRRRHKGANRPAPADRRDVIVAEFYHGETAHATALDALIALGVDRQVALDALQDGAP